MNFLFAFRLRANFFFCFASSTAKIFRFSFVSGFLKIPGEFVRFFMTSQRSMPLEGQGRWLEASQVLKVH